MDGEGSDAMGGGQGNLYLYVGGDSIDAIDPNGTFAIPVAVICGLAAIAAATTGVTNWANSEAGQKAIEDALEWLTSSEDVSEVEKVDDCRFVRDVYWPPSPTKTCIYKCQNWGALVQIPKHKDLMSRVVAMNLGSSVRSAVKQARAFGVGVLAATQNPMNVDYRALGNAGVWCVGRLQTDADCARILDGLTAVGTKGPSTATLGKVVRNLSPRWFLLRDVHMHAGAILLQPCCAMSYLRGPMTRNEIRQALELSRARASSTVPKSRGARTAKVIEG